MPEPHPKPENLYNVDYEIPNGVVPPCMREGLQNVVRNNDNWPSLAIGTFIAELHDPNEGEHNETVQRVTLHCASKALGKCGAEINTYAPYEAGRAPKTGVFDAGQLDRLKCPRYKDTKAT